MRRDLMNNQRDLIARSGEARGSPPTGTMASPPAERKKKRSTLTLGLGKSRGISRCKSRRSVRSADGAKHMDEGRIRFPGARRPARWLRWSGSEEPLSLLRVLMRTWRLPPPSSLISVIGTVLSDNDDFDEQQEALLRRGLKRVLQKTKGWLITSGTRDGLGALVGSAVHGTTLPCIAILPWAAAGEHEFLVNQEIYHYGSGRATTEATGPLPHSRLQKRVGRRGSKLVFSKARSGSGSDKANETDTAKESSPMGICNKWARTKDAVLGKKPNVAKMWRQAVDMVKSSRGIWQHRLEHNHTHFLFVDDGILASNASSADLAWYELKTRQQLEKAICSTDLAGDGVMTPMLTLLVGGDIATLQLALNRLQEGLPVLVLPDTGGVAADLRHWALNGCIINEKEADPEYTRRAQLIIPQVLKFAEDNTMARLTFLELNPDEIDVDSDVELTLTQSILNKCNDGIEQVMLSVAWGELAILEEVLEKTETFDHEGISMALQLALLRSDNAMVETLIDFNASPRFLDLERFFTQDRNVMGLKGSSADSWKTRNATWEKIQFAAGYAPGQQKMRDRATVLFKEAIPLDRTTLSSGNLGSCSGASSPFPTPDTEKQGDIEKQGSRSLLFTRTRTRRSSHKWRQVGELTKLTAPWSILADWVEGYKYHLDVRRAHGTLEPNWTDLMLWAVLTGEKELVKTCWARTTEPLRASLMASMLLRRLSSLSHLRADQGPMRQQADALEDDALSLLDAIPEQARAMPLIAMVPCMQMGLPLWQHSVLDVAANDEGVSYACMRFVAHRHSQQLLEAFFSGDFPGSRARIKTHSSLLVIALQAFFFFVPGTFCEVMPSSGVLSEEVVASSGADYPGVEEEVVISNDAGDEASELDPEEELNKPNELENTLKDLLEDIKSHRWFFFFLVPKVKFVMYLICHFLQLTCLSVVVFASQDDETGALLPEVRMTEALYWLWSLLFFAAELKEFKDFGIEGITQYWRSFWNKIDLTTVVLVICSMSLRILCYWFNESEDPEQTGQCAELEVWARNTYGVVLSLLCFKILSYGTYFESIGVYIIILGEVARRDVSVVFVLIFIISTGVGLTFTLLMSRYNQTIQAANGFSRPIFTPYWSLVGYFNEMDIPKQVGQEEPTRFSVPVVLLCYLVAVIVLINLLIASMTETYQKVKDSAELYWLFERSQLIHEFKRKGALPPPLNIFTILFHDVPRAIRSLIRRLLGRGRSLSEALNESAAGSVYSSVRDGFAMVPGPTQMRRYIRRMQLARQRAESKLYNKQQGSLEHQVVEIRKQLTGLSQSYRDLEQLNASIYSMWFLEQERRQSCLPGGLGRTPNGFRSSRMDSSSSPAIRNRLHTLPASSAPTARPKKERQGLASPQRRESGTSSRDLHAQQSCYRLGPQQNSPPIRLAEPRAAACAPVPATAPQHDEFDC